MSIDLPICKCPKCGKVLNDATVAFGERLDAEPGDSWSICFYCGAIVLFDKQLNTLRLPTPAEWSDVESDPAFFGELQAQQRLVIQFRKAGKAN